MIKVKSSGDYSKTRDDLHKLLRGDLFSNLDKFGQMGVLALMAATPQDTGRTAHSWEYRIIKIAKGIRLEWYNLDQAGKTGISVAILLQYGHGTGTGGYVQGRDYINPALRPVFDAILEDLRKKVSA